MISRTLVRALITPVALAAGVLLAGCNGEELSLASNAKANKPIPERLVADIQKKDMETQSPMLVRLFKQEAELEVWKQDRSGRYALLKTYPICRWSGDLGPKVKEGDRQAPEGFYNITPAQMNPQSAFYLSFNMGYPNAYDKAWGRTGSQLMIHGDCSSRGCYAMSDEQISEIYSLGRESFFGGQRSFQVQAFPFRMTPQNMAKHRNNPNMPFWKMIKEGYDHFEVTRLEPKVDVCEKKYVFDAEQDPNAKRPPQFSPAEKCPVYQIPQEIAEAVREKRQKENQKLAELISRGSPVAVMRTGIDGGMHQAFASKLPNGQTGLSDTEGSGFKVASFTPAPGTIPPHVNPPRAPEPPPGAEFVSAVSALAPSQEPKVAVASSNANASTNVVSTTGSFLRGLAQKVGLGSSESPPPTATAKAAKPAKPKASELRELRTAEPKADAKSAGTEVVANGLAGSRAAAPAATASPQPASQAIAGAQPVVPSSSFESRWSSVR